AYEKGKHTLQPFLEKDKHPEIYLAAAHLSTSNEALLDCINKALSATHMAPGHLKSDNSLIPYDCLSSDLSHALQGDNALTVTVIVPVYNGASVIGTALESLLHQTWQAMEIIVVDDGSTDDTVQIVNSFMAADDRIHLLHTPENSGPYIARNIALEQA